MKKLIALLLVTGMVIGANCAKKKIMRKKAPDYKTEGWIDNDTFQVMAKGVPIESARGFMRRRKLARQNATMMAQRRTQKLMAQDLGGDDAEKKINEKIFPIIEKGKLVEEFGVGEFNMKDEFEGPFRVSEPGLREKVYALTGKKIPAPRGAKRK